MHRILTRGYSDSVACLYGQENSEPFGLSLPVQPFKRFRTSFQLQELLKETGEPILLKQMYMAMV